MWESIGSIIETIIYGGMSAWVVFVLVWFLAVIPIAFVWYISKEIYMSFCGIDSRWYNPNLPSYEAQIKEISTDIKLQSNRKCRFRSKIYFSDGFVYWAHYYTRYHTKDSISEDEKLSAYVENSKNKALAAHFKAVSLNEESNLIQSRSAVCHWSPCSIAPKVNAEIVATGVEVARVRYNRVFYRFVFKFEDAFIYASRLYSGKYMTDIDGVYPNKEKEYGAKAKAIKAHQKMCSKHPMRRFSNQ